MLLSWKINERCLHTVTLTKHFMLRSKYYFTRSDLVSFPAPSPKQGSGDETRFNLDLIQTCNALDTDQNTWTVYSVQVTASLNDCSKSLKAIFYIELMYGLPEVQESLLLSHEFPNMEIIY